MKYSTELIYWLDVNTENSAKKKILSDSDWDERTIQDVKRLEALDIKPTDRVLDFGCGIGRLMREIAPRCSSIVGADISDSMLLFAQDYCHGINDNLYLLPMRSESLLDAVLDNTIDKIYSILVLQHIEKPKAIYLLQEFKRVLKPNGKMYLQFPSNLNKDFYFRYMEKKWNLDSVAPLVEFYSKEELEMIFNHLKINIVKIEDDGKDFYILAKVVK